MEKFTQKLPKLNNDQFENSSMEVEKSNGWVPMEFRKLHLSSSESESEAKDTETEVKITKSKAKESNDAMFKAVLLYIS